MSKPNNKKASTKTQNVQDDDLMGVFSPSPVSVEENETPKPKPKAVAKKRPQYDEMEDEGDYDDAGIGGAMKKMLAGFGADMSKSLSNKKRRIQQVTTDSLRSSTHKLDAFKVQQKQRMNIQSEYARQVSLTIQQWETDIEKAKEHEEKMANLLRQQATNHRQLRLMQSQKLSHLRKLHTEYVNVMEDLEKRHTSQQSSIQADLKKEMGKLQKKILMETQHQDMANVRKSLSTILT